MYALITPARNEADSLAVLASAVVGQTRPPSSWVIVDDGSSDATAEVAAQLALQYPWIVLVQSERVEAGLREGRRQGRDLLSFQEGLRAVPRPVELVAKLDADVTLPPHYFERLLAAFAADPQLGMASGTRCELIGGRWRPRPLTRSTIAGQCRTYRLACWEAIQPLEPHMGWDGIDEARAVLAGWRVHPIPELYFRHHRPRGRRDGSAWRARAAEGSAAHYMGYRPSYILLRALWHARHEPSALAMLWGWSGAVVRREPPCSDAAARGQVRAMQAARHFGRRYREARGATTG
jgi:glycosyltransferase involved in cell wall biosynthesis